MLQIFSKKEGKKQMKKEKEVGIIVTLLSDDELTRQTLLELALNYQVYSYDYSENSLLFKSKRKDDIQHLRESIKSHDLDVEISSS